jgi:hypothetical protein
VGTLSGTPPATRAAARRGHSCSLVRRHPRPRARAATVRWDAWGSPRRSSATRLHQCIHLVEEGVGGAVVGQKGHHFLPNSASCSDHRFLRHRSFPGGSASKPLMSRSANSQELWSRSTRAGSNQRLKRGANTGAPATPCRPHYVARDPALRSGTSAPGPSCRRARVRRCSRSPLSPLGCSCDARRVLGAPHGGPHPRRCDG